MLSKLDSNSILSPLFCFFFFFKPGRREWPCSFMLSAPQSSRALLLGQLSPPPLLSLSSFLIHTLLLAAAGGCEQLSLLPLQVLPSKAYALASSALMHRG